jgi:hypothetical protein
MSIILTNSQYSASPYPLGATKWTARATSGANAAATTTAASQTGLQHYVMGYLVIVSGAAVGAAGVVIQLKDGSTEKVYDMIAAAAPIGSSVSLISSTPLMQGTATTAANLVVGAGGTGVITEATMWGYYM